MTSHNVIGDPDEDEHYAVRELGRPSKAFRSTYASAESRPRPPSTHDGHGTDARGHTILPMAAQSSLQAGPSFSVANAASMAGGYPAAYSESGILFAVRGANVGADDGAATDARIMQQYPQLAAAIGGGAKLALTGSGGSPAEHVRASKSQAIEIIHALDAEGLLEQPADEYIRDVEASYNENDPKLVFPKLRAAWSQEEDRLLKVGVRIYGPNTESWPRIAMLVPGRTNKSCRKRWFHSLDPSLHKGPWTAEEDELLRQRVAQLPSQWSRVAEGIPGRTDDQCAKRWRESLDPEIDRGKWRPEEDRLLLEKFEELGTQWQKIATFFQGRPGLHCRNRWRKIQRIISQKEKKTGPIPPGDLSRTLATVTESVNRRKTAQRSRAHGRSQMSTTPIMAMAGRYDSPMYAETTAAELQTVSAAMDAHHMFGFGRMDASSAMAAPAASSAAFDHAQGGAYTGAPGPYLQPNRSQEQLYQAAAQFGIAPDPSTSLALAAASMIAPYSSNRGDNIGLAYSEDMKSSRVSLINTAINTALASPGIRQHAQQYSGSPESTGALFMPSSDIIPTRAITSSTEGSLRASSARNQGTTSVGAKRSSSALFSPTDEQRQRLRMLGRRLYGCAAAPDACEAAFVDALGLNSHIKLVHPMVASLIPSLNAGNSPGGLGRFQASDGLSPQQHAQQTLSHNARNMPKPYRCAMPGCNHSYKNANGLEYHIFYSRKATDHLALAAGSGGDAGGAVVDVAMDGGGGVPLGSVGASSPAAAHASESGASNPDSGATASMPVPSTEAATGSRMLQCSEVDCLASFVLEHELRQHVAAQHMRPIRRATKPSHRAKAVAAAAAANAAGGSPVEHSPGATGSFWNQMSIGDVLATPTAEVPARNSMSMAESSGVAAAAMAAANGDATVAAIAAAMRYGTGAHKLAPTPGMSGQQLFSPLLPSAVALRPTNSHLSSLAGLPHVPFVSAPALISETGGEPKNITSYFALGLASMDAQGHRQQQQQPQVVETFTPMMLGAAPRSNTMNVAPPALPSEGQARPAGSHEPAIRQATVADNLQLEMDLMQSVLSPFFPPGGAHDAGARDGRGDGGRTQPDGEGDVQMGDAPTGNESHPRDRRSDSIDMASLATVPVGAGTEQAAGTSTVTSALTQSPTMLPRPGLHPQMATALMAQHGGEQMPAAMAAASAAVAAAASAGGNGLPLSSWPQHLTSLGLLSVPTSVPSRHSMYESGPPQTLQQPRIYTPQPTDLAQFQGRPLVHSAQGEQAHGANYAALCPAPGCDLSFIDAALLKHHLHFDHTREETLLAGNYSSPSSPMVSGFLPALPSSRPAFGVAASAPLSAATQLPTGAIPQQQPQQQFHQPLQAAPGGSTVVSAGDRAKAPHWVDPNLWSMWIAAANGQGNVTAAAAATAMGITPGIAGVPQVFLQHQQQQAGLQSAAAARRALVTNDPAADDELLRMFEMVSDRATSSQAPLS